MEFVYLIHRKQTEMEEKAFGLILSILIIGQIREKLLLSMVDMEYGMIKICCSLAVESLSQSFVSSFQR